MEYRRSIWQHLATDMRLKNLDQIARTITLGELPGAIADILKGNVKGRLVVSIEK